MLSSMRSSSERWSGPGAMAFVASLVRILSATKRSSLSKGRVIMAPQSCNGTSTCGRCELGYLRAIFGEPHAGILAPAEFAHRAKASLCKRLAESRGEVSGVVAPAVPEVFFWKPAE